MSNLKAAVGEKEAVAIRKRLNIWARSNNTTCADCNRSNPTWASVNLGVLVCLECAGRHRALGTHISKMRSITLDTVLPEEATFLLSMTNALANRYWEASLSSSERTRLINSPNFISRKYADKRWALSDSSVPVPSTHCVPHSHPWWRAEVNASPTPAVSSSQLQQVNKKPTELAANRPPESIDCGDLIDFGDDMPGCVGQSVTQSDPFALDTSAVQQPAKIHREPRVVSSDPGMCAKAGQTFASTATQPIQDPFAGQESGQDLLIAAEQSPACLANNHVSQFSSTTEVHVNGRPTTIMTSTPVHDKVNDHARTKAETAADRNARILALYDSPQQFLPGPKLNPPGMYMQSRAL